MYIRRSRADVEAEKMGQGATLSRHFDTLMALAKKMKIVIADKDIYREIVSGYNFCAARNAAPVARGRSWHIWRNPVRGC